MYKVNKFSRQYLPNIQNAMLKKIYRFHSSLAQDKWQQIKGASFLIVHSIPSEEGSIKVFGEKLCQAINLNKQELGILAIKDSDFFDFGALKNSISEGHIIWMSEHPEEYFPNVRVQKYKWLEIGGYHILFADSARALMQDKSMKAKLWESLKNEFL